MRKIKTFRKNTRGIFLCLVVTGIFGGCKSANQDSEARDLMRNYEVASGPRNEFGRHVIRFYIEQQNGNLDLPILTGSNTTNLTLQRFMTAFESWFMHLNVEVSRERDDPNQANIRINTAPIEEAFFAEIGPPNGNTLTITFNENLEWSPEFFQATAGRAIGTILGVKKEGIVTVGQLMNSSGTSPILPQYHDIEAAKRIWGPR